MYFLTHAFLPIVLRTLKGKSENGRKRREAHTPSRIDLGSHTIGHEHSENNACTRNPSRQYCPRPRAHSHAHPLGLAHITWTQHGHALLLTPSFCTDCSCIDCFHSSPHTHNSCPCSQSQNENPKHNEGMCRACQYCSENRASVCIMTRAYLRKQKTGFMQLMSCCEEQPRKDAGHELCQTERTSTGSCRS